MVGAGAFGALLAGLMNKISRWLWTTFLAAVSSGWATLAAWLYCPRVLGQWFDGIRFYAAASSPRRSRRTWAGLR